MIKLIWLLMIAVPQQGGKVVLETHVPAAEFYLDGNFVAVTDANGLLTMENFPAGSFNYSVVKKGYQPYKGSFTIGEGEIQRLTPALERVIEQESLQEKASKPADAIPAAAAPPKAAEVNSATPAAKAQPLNLEDSTAQVPVTPPSPEQTASERPQAYSLLLISSILIAVALIILSITIRKKRRLERQIPLIGDALETEPVRPQPDGVNRPDPGFIEGLRRREELLKAGFIRSHPQVVDPGSMKEKEVVIVLPKEAFRIEDDN
jgi:hypothetical protein